MRKIGVVMTLESSTSFAGKTVIVTGASSGIGAATLRAFASQGARVAAVARTRVNLEARTEELTKLGFTAEAFVADISDEAAMVAVFEQVSERFGGIDVLVNNAAINHRGPFEEATPAQLSEVILTNLLAPALLMRLALPYMRKRGGGAIVNVASLAGRVPLIYEAAYSASKFGLRGLSFAVADELAGSGISVSIVSPGPVSTGFILSDMESVSDVVFSQPMSSPEEIARLIVACALDGKQERTPSWLVRVTSTVGYLFPALRRATTPILQRRGRAAKDQYRAKHPGHS